MCTVALLRLGMTYFRLKVNVCDSDAISNSVSLNEQSLLCLQTISANDRQLINIQQSHEHLFSHECVAQWHSVGMLYVFVIL